MKFAVTLFVLAVLYRVIAGDFGSEHLWLLNFSPLAALALCGPVVFPRRVSLLLPLSILLVSDIMLNLHFGTSSVNGQLLSRYVGLAAIALLGLRLRECRQIRVFLFASTGGSVFFFLITNSVSWLASPGYGRNLGGWVQALTLGLPGYPPTWLFFRNSLVSDTCFTLAFLGSLALATHLEMAVKKTMSGSQCSATGDLCGD